MIMALLAVGIAVFLIIDTLSNITVNTSSLLFRARAAAHYWIFFKYSEGNVSAYSNATSTVPARSIPVLLYHGESASKGNTPVSLFVDQMRALKKNGWRTITMEQFNDYMKGGTPLPDKSFLLTFDDGRRDTFYPFDPIISDMEFNAVMFVVTGFSMPEKGRTAAFYLNKKELEFMLKTGRWELQSHGNMDHFKYNVQSTTDLDRRAETMQGNFLSNRFWNDEANRFETDQEFAERIRTDLIEARQMLENNFGSPTYAFAYPFNDFGPSTVNFPGSTDIIERVVPTVYTYAFYQHWPANGDSFNYPRSGEFNIKRIEPPLDWDGQDLMRALEAGYAKPLPYTAVHIGDEWVGIWGDIEKRGGTITLQAKGDSSGSSTFLNGSGWWRDYTFSAEVHWIAGETVSLLARNTNDTDHIACSFLQGSVAIDEFRDNQERRIADARLSISRAGAQLGMRVQGQTVQCLEDGSVVLSASFSGHPSGGIGFKVWNVAPGVAKASFMNISAGSL
jgi:poly-beta-1,6-N-acetyl-D-glucosamine N-deacetylase